MITRYGYGRPCKSIEIIEAGHPIPDLSGLQATRRMLDLLNTSDTETFVLALISGGASALLVQPIEPITLAEKREFTEALLASGAPIQILNVIRKAISRVKGGQLAAAAYPAKVLGLIISDVPGDDPALIGSGPTVVDSSTAGQALSYLTNWKIKAPKSVLNVLVAKEQAATTVSALLSKVENVIVAAPSQSLLAAAAMAREADCEVISLGDAVKGEASIVAIEHATRALSIQNSMKPYAKPIVLLSGGELTVTRRGNGIGGPNAEYMLAMAIALGGAREISGIACDTDGVDGVAEVAGAVIDETTLRRAVELGLYAQSALRNNDAHTFFHGLGDQIVTGPTLTNVNDFRAILISPKVANHGNDKEPPALG